MKRRNGARRTKKNLKIKIMQLVLILIIAFSLIIFLQNLISRIKKDDIKANVANSQNNSNSQNTNVKEKEKNDTNGDSNSPEPTEEQPQIPKEVSFDMLLTGDIMCHNTMYQDAYDSSTKSYDFSYMFDDIKYYIQTADIAIGNLETTFAGSKRGYSNYPSFNTPEQLADNLKKIGFDVVSTANNHCMDTGYTGLVSTLQYLDKADLSHTGTYSSEEDSKKILIKDVKGVKIAFLSFTYGTNGIPVPKAKSYAVNFLDEETISEQLKLAKKENPDIICVSMHWGIEYQTTPNATQRKWADYLFENGADIIIGNHPHVPQPMEMRKIKLDDGTTKDGFVIYSLGNFMADQRSQYTRDSALLNLNISKNNETGKISINSATYTPIYYYKNLSISKKRFKFIDIKKAIEAYDAGVDTSIGKTLYNTLVTELKNIKKIIGDEIQAK